MPDDTQLMAAVSSRACETYSDVLNKLASVSAALDQRDGLYWFNRLYHAMTDAVAKQAGRGMFHDAVFLEALDCLFAELYFAAIRSRLAHPGSEPRAWTPLFDARHSSGIAPLQFAVAGMNAHINRDLVVALVAAFNKLGGEPVRGSARHGDYLSINDVLGQVHSDAKAFLFSETLVAIDEHFGSSDDMAELWSLERARDAAWVGFEVQWQLRPLPWLADGQFDALDKLVGCTGRCLLHRLQPA